LDGSRFDATCSLQLESVRTDLNSGHRSIDFKLGASPVASLGVVPDFVIGLVAEPVGQRAVLPLHLRQPLLDDERLVGSLS